MTLMTQRPAAGVVVKDVRTYDVRRRLAYGAAFYAQAVPALLRRHRLRSDTPTSYRAVFDITESQLEAWAAAFAVDPKSRLPFTYGNTSATMILMRILTDLGINFRYVRHLRCDLRLPTEPYQPNMSYTLATQVRKPMAMRKDRVAIVTDTDVIDMFGARVARQTDVWCILSVSPADVERAALPPGGDIEALKGLTRLKARIQGGEHLAINVPRDMGTRYGWISGDLNPTHLSHVAARLFGSPKAFVQGFCTVNMLIAAAHRLGMQPARLSTTLTRPVFVGQTVELRVEGGDLELCDTDGALLAVACWAPRV